MCSNGIWWFTWILTLEPSHNEKLLYTRMCVCVCVSVSVCVALTITHNMHSVFVCVHALRDHEGECVCNHVWVCVCVFMGTVLMRVYLFAYVTAPVFSLGQWRPRNREIKLCGCAPDRTQFQRLAGIRHVCACVCVRICLWTRVFLPRSLIPRQRQLVRSSRSTHDWSSSDLRCRHTHTHTRHHRTDAQHHTALRA